MSRRRHPVHRLAPAAAAAGLALCFLASCGDGDRLGNPNLPQDCPDGAFLTVSPIPLPDLLEVAPLGNINPPGHIAPSDHIGLTIRVEPGADAPVVTDLLCPGDLVVERVTAFQTSRPGHADAFEYSITLLACEDIILQFGHVTDLDTTLFGPLAGFPGWELVDTQVDGEVTFTTRQKSFNLPVAAGVRLGSGGGHRNQWGVDLGLYDLSRPPEFVASDLWDTWYAWARCPLAYFTAGALQDTLYALLTLPDAVRDDPVYGCGVLHEDIVGALQGVWFPAVGASMDHEDRDISFSHLSSDPRVQIIANGGAASATFPSWVYDIDPVLDTGFLNRDFASVIADGSIYGYHVTGEGGDPWTILTRLVSADTLWCEGFPGHLAPETWAFSAAHDVYIR